MKHMVLNGSFKENEKWQQRIGVFYDRPGSFGGFFIGLLQYKKETKGAPYLTAGRVEGENLAGIVLSFDDSENTRARYYKFRLDKNRIAYNNKIREIGMPEMAQPLDGYWLWGADDDKDVGQIKTAQITDYQVITEPLVNKRMSEAIIAIINSFPDLPVGGEKIAEIYRRTLQDDTLNFGVAENQSDIPTYLRKH